jgi:hypothetical protein
MTAMNTGPRVLTVGAYQMDNFGDYLLLFVTEEILKDAELVVAAPFTQACAVDVTPMLGRRVHAYGPLLTTRKFDLVWTVGGEMGGERGTGGLDLEFAYWMSVPPAVYDRFRELSSADREKALRLATGAAPVVSPYIPSLELYPENSSTLSVVNSVGIAHILDGPECRRQELAQLLRRTDLISVRDKESSSLLDSLGITHRLAPDVVHAIGVLWPGERPSEPNVAVLQISRRIVAELGETEIADFLAHSPSLRGMQIRLLLAGTETIVDSVQEKQRLAGQVRSRAPHVDIAVIDERDPRALVEHIRTARVVIGTSLHLRIVSCAYGVPRVTLSFSSDKPNKYARFWDPHMPHYVTLDSLDEAVKTALARERDPEVLGHSRELSQRAYDNLKSLYADARAALRRLDNTPVSRRGEAQ